MSRPTYADSIIPDHHYDLTGIRILLVEDVEFNVLVAEKMITNWHATVDVAENGVIAVSKARDNTYDLVLMDLQMPVMDGYSATQYIRQFNPDIPIIALTASATQEMMEETLKLGMTDYMKKPFRSAELYNMIYKHTHKKPLPLID